MRDRARAAGAPCKPADLCALPASASLRHVGRVLACRASDDMSGREAFGPNLRRLRLQRGISLEEIARRTKVSAELWAGLERNDLSRWPTGIFARAYVREYAHVLGIEAEHTVDEFCRCF